MSKEIEKVKEQPVALKGVQATQKKLIMELQTTYESVGCPISEYGKQCAMAAINGATIFLSNRKQSPRSLEEIDAQTFKLCLQSVALLELNYGAYPSEIYFDLRDKTLSIKAQGAGNEKLVRKFGVGVAENGLYPCWIVREGDEFELPTYDGLNISSPKWKRKSLSGKALYVVYPLKKADGSVEYLMADREGVKTNVVAQIRQNTLYKFNSPEKKNAFYEQLNIDAEKMTLDELITSKEYVPYINPTYTSYGSKEAMIIRKMMNNALKNYPKEFNGFAKEAMENIIDDRDDSLRERNIIQDADVVDKVEKELKEEPKAEDAPQDFDVDEDGVIENEKTSVKPQPSEVPAEEDNQGEDADEVDAYDGIFD